MSRQQPDLEFDSVVRAAVHLPNWLQLGNEDPLVQLHSKFWGKNLTYESSHNQHSLSISTITFNYAGVGYQFEGSSKTICRRYALVFSLSFHRLNTLPSTPNTQVSGDYKTPDPKPPLSAHCWATLVLRLFLALWRTIVFIHP
jgi:hypothetical protein